MRGFLKPWGGHIKHCLNKSFIQPIHALGLVWYVLYSHHLFILCIIIPQCDCDCAHVSLQKLPYLFLAATSHHNQPTLVNMLHHFGGVVFGILILSVIGLKKIPFMKHNACPTCHAIHEDRKCITSLYLYMYIYIATF